MSRSHRHGGAFLFLAAAALWVAGCGSDGGGDRASSTSAPATTVVDDTVVTADVQFAADRGGDSLPSLLDVYAPPLATGLPIVIFFHGGGADKQSIQYPEIGRALAANGVVAVFPNWGPSAGLPPETGTVAAVNSDMATARCAVSYVVAHAMAWGGDPTRLVLVGHSAGANVASVVMFSYDEPVLDGCAVSLQQWQPQAAMVWDGEIALLDESLWNNYADVLPELFTALTPWSHRAAAKFDGPVAILVTSSFNDTATRCDATADWITARDPSGAFGDALAAVNATADGCVSIGEVHQAFAWFLSQGEVGNDYAEFDDPASLHDHLSDTDLAALVDQLSAIAAATVHGASNGG